MGMTRLQKTAWAAPWMDDAQPLRLNAERMPDGWTVTLSLNR